jgi:hypothetical protein
MAPAPKPKEEPRRGEPKEAGATGGAPADGRPPASEPSDWVEVELVTVSQDGERLVRQIKDLTLSFAMNQAASHILMDIFEAVKDEVLQELPRPRIRATIYGTKTGNVFKVEVKGNNFTKVYHIPKEKAVYYFGGFDIKGFYVYVRIEAVYVPSIRTTFYEVIVDDNTVRVVGEDLYRMLKE